MQRVVAEILETKCDGQTNGLADGLTDGWTEGISIVPFHSGIGQKSEYLCMSLRFSIVCAWSDHPFLNNCIMVIKIMDVKYFPYFTRTFQ